ncbi:MAG: PD40 domain-containing protein [Candidatus Aminicenantes bacterium]|nr:MAG: PD40 domain-containing protein [Candidatus Aminicenantes bacterium]
MRVFKKCFFLFSLFLIGANLSFSQIIYFPYYGKNKVLYTKFDWKVYKTEHFDIFYYGDDTRDLKKIADLAESAYKSISEEIKHQLSASVPLLYYRTSTEFYQTNLFQLPEGVLGVAEPLLYRIAIQGDMPIDEIHNLIEHEVTHVFEYDLLWGSPGGVLYALSQPPGWIFEGFCEYNTRTWAPWSAMIVRDAALNDRIPDLVGNGHLYSRYPLPRVPDYDFGHALFDFIEHKYGKNGIRDFWHSMKNSPLIGNQNPIRRAFDTPVKEFGFEFKKYLRAKYKPFLTRENPEDYSIPLGPEFPLNPYYHAWSISLSPSGDIVAALLANYKELDYDIILFSTKDGKAIKNITKGYTLKYEFIRFDVEPSKGRDIAWSADGDRIAFFGRAGKKHSLFIVNPLSGKIVQNIKINQDQPSSPCFFPDKNELLFTAFENGIHDIFKVNLANGEVLNLTSNDLFEKAPVISHDGKYIAYTIRLDAFDKLFISPSDNLKKRTQLTFGKGNTIVPIFSPDDKELYFSGDIREAYNIYSLNLETGELLRYTDVRTGNLFPHPMPNESDTILFSSFNKGAFQIFKSEFEGQKEESVTFADMDYDEEFERFEPIVSVDIDEKKIAPYKGLGKLYLNNRPPVGAIISTDGSIYGGTALSFSDLLGDHNFTLLAYQVRSFRSYLFSYVNLKRRFQFAAEAFQYTMFYYTPYNYVDPLYYDQLSYRDAMATRTMMGASFTGYYPFNRYYRAQVGLSFLNYEEDFYDPYLMNQARGQQNQGYGYFYNGNALTASASLIGETTNFRMYGPYSGNTFMLGLSQTIPVTNRFIRNTTVQADLRQYLPIGGNTLFAFRLNVMASMGRNPYVFYWGGNNQVRSSYYYNIVGNEGWYANLELRIPLVNAANTILGLIGPIRGVFFLDLTRAKLKGYPAKIFDIGYDERGIPILRAADAIGSYGFGFQFFFLGLPLHFDWAKRLEIVDISSPFSITSFGKYELKFWIGFDF